MKNEHPVLPSEQDDIATHSNFMRGIAATLELQFYHFPDED